MLHSPRSRVTPAEVSVVRKHEETFSLVKENTDGKESSANTETEKEQEKDDEEIQIIDDSPNCKETRVSEQDPASR